MFDRRRRSGVWRTLLVRVPLWTAGFTVVLAGFAAVRLGIWEYFEPDAFDRFVANLSKQYNAGKRLAR